MDTDLAAVSGELEKLLRLRSIVFAMQLFERREDMEAIPRIRRPKAVHTLDQIVGQASRLGWTSPTAAFRRSRSDHLAAASSHSQTSRSSTPHQVP